MQFGEMFWNTEAHTELMQVSVGFNYFVLTMHLQL